MQMEEMLPQLYIPVKEFPNRIRLANYLKSCGRVRQQAMSKRKRSVAAPPRDLEVLEQITIAIKQAENLPEKESIALGTSLKLKGCKTKQDVVKTLIAWKGTVEKRI